MGGFGPPLFKERIMPLPPGKYLKKYDDDRLFFYTDILFERGDMVVVVIPEENAESKPAPAPAPGDDFDPGRLQLIKDAINKLDPVKDYSRLGVPKIDAIEASLTFPITRQERDAVWLSMGEVEA